MKHGACTVQRSDVLWLPALIKPPLESNVQTECPVNKKKKSLLVNPRCTSCKKVDDDRTHNGEVQTAAKTKVLLQMSHKTFTSTILNTDTGFAIFFVTLLT